MCGKMVLAIHMARLWNIWFGWRFGKGKKSENKTRVVSVGPLAVGGFIDR
jgi:hypothetical protein